MTVSTAGRHPVVLAGLAGMATLGVLTGCGSAPEADAPAPAAVALPEQVTIARVVDGDTFVIGDGRTVRVLGIDSCELGTPGGEEGRRMAEQRLADPAGQPVTLTSQPDVETTPDGMLLRYVQLRGADYAEQMVGYEHTGVVTTSGADPGYVGRLQPLDTRDSTRTPPVARDCGTPAAIAPPPTTTTVAPAPPTTEEQRGDPDPDRRVVPRPRPNPGGSDDGRDDGRNSGGRDSGGRNDGGRNNGDGGRAGGGDNHNGHPCGPGERDGDHDGFCGEH